MERRKTREVQVGSVTIGGGHPVVVQSMTNTKTEDAAATLAQIRDLQELGCEVIRCAVPTMSYSYPNWCQCGLASQGPFGGLRSSYGPCYGRSGLAAHPHP